MWLDSCGLLSNFSALMYVRKEAECLEVDDSFLFVCLFLVPEQK